MTLSLDDRCGHRWSVGTPTDFTIHVCIREPEHTSLHFSGTRFLPV